MHNAATLRADLLVILTSHSFRTHRMEITHFSVNTHIEVDTRIWQNMVQSFVTCEGVNVLICLIRIYKYEYNMTC